MIRGSTPENCLDIVRPFIEELQTQETPEVQIMGGVGSAALKHAGTVILPEEKRIVTSKDFLRDSAGRPNQDLSIRRANGTLRDLDALVLSEKQADIDHVETIARQTINDRLDISIFGLRDGDYLEKQLQNPLGFTAARAFLSDRYVQNDGQIIKALFPFGVSMDKEVLEGWDLQVGDETYPVLNPAVAVLNYLTRSISGLRRKDFDKVQSMAGHVFTKSPELLDWTVDGPGQSHLELAGVLQTLRRSNSWPPRKKTLKIGDAFEVKSDSIRALREHPAFLLRESESEVQNFTLFWSATKSRGLGIGESSEKLVEIYQKFAEKHFDFITKNK